MQTQSNLLPLGPSPLSVADGYDIDEVLNYGTDADCRLALIAIMESLPKGIDSVDELIGKYEELTDKVETLECDVSDVEKERDNEIEHGRKLMTIANDLAMSLIDLMERHPMVPDSELGKKCNNALTAFEEL